MMDFERRIQKKVYGETAVFLGFSKEVLTYNTLFPHLQIFPF